MITDAIRISQPYSGEYRERIYEVSDSWNCDEWTWIKFFDETEYWCGQFKGKYIGAAISEKYRIAIILTEGCLYVLDTTTAEIIDYDVYGVYRGIIKVSDDILISHSCGIQRFTDRTIAGLEDIEFPKGTDDPDSISFHEVNNEIVRVTWYDYNSLYGIEKEGYYDCSLNTWSL